MALVVAVIVGLSIVLMLTRPRGIAEVWWVTGGAVALLVARQLAVSDALHAIAKGADVYFFLTGMMLLAQLGREHGVFDWVARVAVRRSRGDGRRLFALIYAAGTLVTIFLSNDATAVVLTPAVLAAVKKAKAEPRPHLFVCALVANAASFVLPISNPANLVVFRGQMPSLDHWLRAFALPSLAAILVTYAVLRWRFAKELSGDVKTVKDPGALPPAGRHVLVGIGVVAVVLIVASLLHWDLGLPTFAAAVVVTGMTSLLARASPLPLVRKISWSTLGLVAALFVQVEAIERAGALRGCVALLERVERLPSAIAAPLTSFVVGVSNNVVNNLPLGLVAGSTLQASHPSPAIRNAVLIGVDLGPNLAVSGSLATILWLLALREAKINISFWDFLAVGALVMPAALLAANLAALL